MQGQEGVLEKFGDGRTPVRLLLEAQCQETAKLRAILIIWKLWRSFYHDVLQKLPESNTDVRLPCAARQTASGKPRLHSLLARRSSKTSQMRLQTDDLSQGNVRTKSRGGGYLPGGG
jgi:hypothetical protein